MFVREYVAMLKFESPEMAETGVHDPAPRVHSSEIAAHELPRIRGGFEEGPTQRWLQVIGAAHAELEDELLRVKDERDRLLAAMRRGRGRQASADIRASLMQSRLRRRPGGYDRGDVENLLRSAASEMVRIENIAALLEAELEAAQSCTPSDLRQQIQELRSDVAAMQVGRLMTGPAELLRPKRKARD